MSDRRPLQTAMPGVDPQSRVRLLELVRAQAENVAAAEEVFAIEEQYSEPTPALQTPAEEAAGILVESVREPAAEAAKEIEEKSHKAVAGE